LPLTRFLIEYLRDDDEAVWAGLTIAQLISLGIFAAGVVLWLWLARRQTGRLADRIESSAAREAVATSPCEGESMPAKRPTADDFLTIGPRVGVLPIIHGSGDCAIRVREELLARPYDCLAVPLPPSFQEAVEEAVEGLPAITAVLQEESPEEGGFSYVPIDPCQGGMAAIRAAIGERIERAFIDLETPRFEAHHAAFPDPYALKRVSPESFASAVLPGIPPPRPGQHADRVAWMAARLRELE